MAGGLPLTGGQPLDGGLPLEGELPELAGVYWRPRADPRTLRRSDRLWTASTAAHVVPFLAVAIGLPLLNPVTIPVGLIALAHAWFIPDLYAARGANVMREPRRPRGAAPRDAAAEDRALGLLGDLVGHEARSLLVQTGFVVEPGQLGTWVVGPAGALLVRGRRVQCYCVRATGDELPLADRIAHLLLALRADESGFATVANLSFSGTGWRVRRRLAPPARVALNAALRRAERDAA